MSQAKERLRNLVNMVKTGSGFCVQCGVVGVDEDGCCCVCGATATGNALDELMNDISSATNWTVPRLRPLHQLAPTTPTPAMIEAGATETITPHPTAGHTAAAAYLAMLAAAPKP